MGVPMQTGYSSLPNSNSRAQQQVLQEDAGFNAVVDLAALAGVKRDNNELPPFWREEFRDGSNKPFYSNSQTGMTTTQRPKFTEENPRRGTDTLLRESDSETAPLLADLFNSPEKGVDGAWAPQAPFSSVVPPQASSMFGNADEAALGFAAGARAAAEEGEEEVALSRLWEEDASPLLANLFNDPEEEQDRTRGTPKEAGTETLLRDVTGSMWEIADTVAPVTGIDKEGRVSTQKEDSKKAPEASPRTDGSVPAQFAPGHNSAQLNWAEKQLAKAQQMNRPRQDLPGYTINAEEEVASVEAPARKTRETEDEEEEQRFMRLLFEEGEDAAELLQQARVQSGAQGSASLLTLNAEGSVVLRGGDTLHPEDRQLQFVDEHACIGCTNCAMIARNTFLMEEDHGRARAFNQVGEDAGVLEEAIASCPVDCIHPVSYSELVQLEDERKDDVINNKSRLVGGSYTAEEKGGTPWLRLMARRSQAGKKTGFWGF